MNVEKIINFLKENKEKLEEMDLVFYDYRVAFDRKKYSLSRSISELSGINLVLPLFKEKYWDIFLQKVKEEITPIPIDKKLVEKYVDYEYLEKLLGMNGEQASKKIKDDGFICRIVEQDGESYIITDDLRSDRVNLRINNNKVIEAHRG